MTKVTMQVWMGNNYAPPEGFEVVHCPSLKGAKHWFKYMPDREKLVSKLDENVFALLFIGDYYDDVTNLSPDYKLSFGPKGGLRCERC